MEYPIANFLITSLWIVQFMMCYLHVYEYLRYLFMIFKYDTLWILQLSRFIDDVHNRMVFRSC